MNGNIVLIIGYPASGKTFFARDYENNGYHRLNRDEIGGSLDGLVDHLENLYSTQGMSKFAMDNTYPTAESRKSVIQWAKKHEFQIECHWIDLDIGDALYNASKRMIDAHGRLLMSDEIKSSKEVGIYPPVVIYKYRKSFEVPTAKEGFDAIHRIEFTRNINIEEYKNKAILMDYDGTLRKTISGEKYPKSPEDIEILPHRTEVLKTYQKEGYLLLGVSNQSFISKKELTVEGAIECFEKTNELLAVKIEYKFCPHRAYPQVCYCRKPMPGLGVEFIEKYKLNPAKCIMVGDMKTDNTFADRCGFQYIHASKFFTLH